MSYVLPPKPRSLAYFERTLFHQPIVDFPFEHPNISKEIICSKSGMAVVGFINLGSLGDRLPHQGSTRESKNNRAKGRSSNRPEGQAQEEQRPLASYFGPPIRPERSIQAPTISGRPL